jgi:hypothetical protein
MSIPRWIHGTSIVFFILLAESVPNLAHSGIMMNNGLMLDNGLMMNNGVQPTCLAQCSLAELAARSLVKEETDRPPRSKPQPGDRSSREPERTL